MVRIAEGLREFLTIERHAFLSAWRDARQLAPERRALKGEPGLFYAMEAGHVLGTPFPATHPISEWQSHALVTGTQFAAFMATPSDIGGTHGAH